MIVRSARLADAAGIAAVHVGAWRSAYAGLLPADYLANLSLVRHAAQHQAGISAGRGVLVADAGGIGFGPSTAAAGYFSPLNVTGSVLASVASGLPQQAGMLLALSVAALLVVRRKV